MWQKNKHAILLAGVVATVALFFLIGTPHLMDDGVHYEGFTEAAAHGRIDFRNFYGFQGLSLLAVLVYWVTQSHIAIIYTSMILFLASIPLAYAVGKKFGSGWLGVMIVLLMPYPYVTLMRGFQEAGLLFFVLLIMYGSLYDSWWTAIAWGFGGIVKPFALMLFPLFKKRFIPLLMGVAILGAYGLINYSQTGHVVSLAAGGSYEGNFDITNIPPLEKSFTLSAKSFARVGANLLVHSRKILLSPLLILLGFLAIRKKYLAAVLLNLLLVALLTFTFPKYLLPAVVLLGFSAIPLLRKHPWLIPLVILDSLAVAIPIYAYFGRVFWPSLGIALLPFYLAGLIGFGIAYRSSR